MSGLSAEFDFLDLAALVVEDTESTGYFQPKVQKALQNRMKLAIDQIRVCALTVGRDPRCVQRAGQHDSLNHSVHYLKLRNDGQIRFSMDNRGSAKQGEKADGDLVVRVHDFEGQSWKSIMSVSRPWNHQNIIRTPRRFIVLLKLVNAHLFEMGIPQSGCRAWAKGVAKVFIEAGFFDLDCDIELFGWKSMTLSGSTERQRNDDRIRQSLQRLDDLYSKYYTSEGQPREMPDLEGEFKQPLPKGPAMMAQWADYLTYEVPEEGDQGAGEV